MKRKPAKDELVESIAKALVDGAAAIKKLERLKMAVHKMLGYDKPPEHVLMRVRKAMGYYDA